MGQPITYVVAQRLREEGIRAELAYPGGRYADIEGPVAAVHLQGTDRRQGTMTVEVVTLCPGKLGGVRCETEALRVCGVLEEMGAICVQGGCAYDKTARVYAVSVLGTFAGQTGAENCAIGPGFRVFRNEKHLPFAVAFTAEGKGLARAEYVMGRQAPEEILPGEGQWVLRLEERIPAGREAEAEDQEAFTLRVETEGKTEVYTGCRWTSLRRVYSQRGLSVIREAAALGREEA